MMSWKTAERTYVVVTPVFLPKRLTLLEWVFVFLLLVASVWREWLTVVSLGTILLLPRAFFFSRGSPPLYLRESMTHKIR